MRWGRMHMATHLRWLVWVAYWCQLIASQGPAQVVSVGHVAMITAGYTSGTSGFTPGSFHEYI